MLHWTTTVYGSSGRSYPVIIPRFLSDLPRVPGVYYKMKAMRDGFLWKVYVGQADDVYRRNLIDDHSNDGHKRAADLGANIIGFSYAPHDEEQRCAWEDDIIDLYDPPANIKKRPPPGALFGGLASLASGWQSGQREYLSGVLSGLEPPAGLLSRLYHSN